MPTRDSAATDADFDLCNSYHTAVVDHHGADLSADNLPVAHRAVLLTWHAMGIIDNGGFQYLFEGDFEGDPGFALTADAFDEIECKPAADAVRAAIALFPDGGVPTDIDKRLELFQATPESKRNELNSKFWAASDVGKGDVCVKLATYIRNNSDAFSELNPE